MIIKTAEFVKSSAYVKDCPNPDKPEFAFIGRSNVGKSSLINVICDKKKLAKTSSQPGKTQLINHFLVNEDWYLVDLPGYGFARVSKEKKAVFEKMISNYIVQRPNLVCLFLLIDSRLPLQQIDSEFMNWLGENEISFVIVYTKSDKLGINQLKTRLETHKKQLMQSWEELPKHIITSSESGKGRDEILLFIEENKKHFKTI